ncbi:hypothetical protein SAMN05444392_101100 [Seinonella peptonophila]|uniref:Uncharacterized protein n=1 Tax=Seinonella peptonophila TaxID=112248 RepID=A0A1M4SR51_9BACL|nr:hypothetical protein SAMN05444392_101100 [Seinonella peptonophila]
MMILNEKKPIDDSWLWIDHYNYYSRESLWKSGTNME